MPMLNPSRTLQPRPPDFDFWYGYGANYYNMLLSSPDGWWQNYQGQPFGQRTFIAAVYNYEINSFLADRLAVSYITEAFSRRYWQAQIDFGPDGIYWYMGGRDMVSARVIANVPGINELDHNMPVAFEQAGLILNPSNLDWCNGVQWDMPYDWGNPTPKTYELLPLFSSALSNGNMGPADNQILYISPDGRFFVMTLGQVNTLCGNQSCVSPSNPFPPQP
jgi:hypothetical protein